MEITIIATVQVQDHKPLNEKNSALHLVVLEIVYGDEMCKIMLDFVSYLSRELNIIINSGEETLINFHHATKLSFPF